MIELSVYNIDVVENGVEIPVYEFNSVYRINIIGGESGTGKTLFMDRLSKALINRDGWNYKCNKDIYIIQSFKDLSERDKLVNNAIFICDEDVSQELYENNISKLLSKSKNYFILIDRSLENKIDTNVKALFIIKSKNKLINKIELFKIDAYIKMNKHNKNTEFNNFTMIVTEDAKSGKEFWTNMLSKLRLIETNNGNASNSLVEVMLEKAMKYTGNILVALDYDSGLTSMMHIIRNDSIDKSRIAFIPMESFEEVLCNSEFILSKFPEMRDKVLNYQDYIDASYKHTGAYFSKLLYDYVKVKSPLKVEGSKNVTKFYDKGMKNFKECFIDNCCVYELSGCKLFYSGDKKEALLNNKFEFLQIFM